MKEYMLFDLDGTLTDPKLGITTCVQYALKAFGIEEPDLDKLEPFIGPPLKDSFMEFYGFDEAKAQKAVEKYRERFQDIGLYENEIYIGIPKMLRTLWKKGIHLAVASSKPTVFVERILEHFKIKKYFEVIVGSELDGTRVNKDEVVQEALRQLFQNKQVEKEKVYMIGDRKFDVEGAHAQGIESVGVSYGYGGLEELKEAQSDYIVRSVAELEGFLYREFVDLKQEGIAGDLWSLAYPVILYILVRQLAGDMASLMCAFAVFIWNVSRRRIEQAQEDMFLEHLKPEPAKSYLCMGIATVGAVVGWNVLAQIMGATDLLGVYQLFSQPMQFTSVLKGLFFMGVVIPMVEEPIFRGILYPILKQKMKRKKAILLSSLCFGICQMNLQQGIYAFGIGCLAAYAFEYFGTFLAPVVVHAIAGVVAYLIVYSAVAKGMADGWPVVVLSLVVAAVGFGIMRRNKRMM